MVITTRIEATPPLSRGRSVGSGVMPRPLRNFSGWLPMEQMSSRRVIAQKGSMPGTSHQCTGDSARSRVQISWGGPWLP